VSRQLEDWLVERVVCGLEKVASHV
jgi:hypothetical protein